MFYFSHPFGISTPQTAGKNPDGSKKKAKYTTTTYLITEIQKNYCNDDQELEKQINASGLEQQHFDSWPKDMLGPEFVLPPLFQAIERRRGEFFN